MKKVAKDHNYDYKICIGGAGGTNTFGYFLSNGGVVTSTISIPLRYMHTPNEMVMLSDVEKTINYYVELLKNIEYKHNFKLV
jgi:endoglucanase